MGKDLKGKELGKGYCQRKDKSYCVRFVNRFGVRQTIYDNSLSNLKRKHKEALQQDASHTNVKKTYTLDEWYKEWMSIYKFGLRDTTLQYYNQVYEKHIRPVLGNKPLPKITTLNVKGLLNSLKKNGYRYETQNKVRIILLDMYNKAMIDDFATKNPVKPITLKRDEDSDPRVLTPTEQSVFFDTCKGTFYEEAFTVQVLTGLRPGELFALDAWTDIDFEHNEISVTKTLVYQKLEGDTQKEFHLHPPKTASSVRKVKFDERCKVMLKRQLMKKQMIASRQSAKPLLNFENLLFVTKYDTPLNPQIYCDAIRRIVDLINENRCEINYFETFSGHCFRHTYATRCFEAGVAPKAVQKQLGHANLKMTMDLYTHLLDDQRDDELAKFSSYSDTVFDKDSLSAPPKVVPLPKAE